MAHVVRFEPGDTNLRRAQQVGQWADWYIKTLVGAELADGLRFKRLPGFQRLAFPTADSHRRQPGAEATS